MSKKDIDETKVAKLVSQVIKLINKNQLSIQEMIVAYGNLGYHLGASIAGFTDKGPNIEELKREYYSNPTVDVGLMIQGLLITDWEEDFRQNPKLSSFANQTIKKEKK